MATAIASPSAHGGLLYNRSHLYSFGYRAGAMSMGGAFCFASSRAMHSPCLLFSAPRLIMRAGEHPIRVLRLSKVSRGLLPIITLIKSCPAIRGLYATPCGQPCYAFGAMLPTSPTTTPKIKKGCI